MRRFRHSAQWFDTRLAASRSLVPARQIGGHDRGRLPVGSLLTFASPSTLAFPWRRQCGGAIATEAAAPSNKGFHVHSYSLLDTGDFFFGAFLWSVFLHCQKPSLLIDAGRWGNRGLAKVCPAYKCPFFSPRPIYV